MNNRVPIPAMQPKMAVQVQIDLQNDIVVCPCGGIAILFNAAFLPKHNITAIGKSPELVISPVLLCSHCGERLKEPVTRAGDVKES
jgi:hypothetical protein